MINSLLQQVLDYSDLNYRDFFPLVHLYRKTKSYLDYHEFLRKNLITVISTWKITIIEVNECSIVNLNFSILGFFDVFGHDGN